MLIPVVHEVSGDYILLNLMVLGKQTDRERKRSFFILPSLPVSCWVELVE